jgi:hypothetical protein
VNTRAKKAEEHGHPEVSPVIKKRIEEKQVQERVAIGARVVHETIRREGEEELKRSTPALAWSGLAAGLSMGFSLVAEGLLAAYLPHAEWAPLVSKLGYSVGFLIVVLGRQQLYTETTLTVILPLLSRRNVATALSVFRLWTVVLVANLVGTYLFALCVGRVPIFSAHIQQILMEVSQGSLQGGFCGLAHRTDGMAASGGGIGACEHYYHPHVSDRPRRVQSRNCRIDEGDVPRRIGSGNVEQLCTSLLFADAAWQHRGRSVAGSIFGACSGGCRPGFRLRRRLGRTHRGTDQTKNRRCRTALSRSAMPAS